MANPFDRAGPQRSLATRIGDFGAALEGGGALERRQALRAEEAAQQREDARLDALAQARELVFSEFQRELEGGSTREQAWANLAKRGVLNEAFILDASILDDVDEAFARTVPGPAQAPQTRKVRMGNEEVAQEFDPVTGQWSEVGRGPAWRPYPDTVVQNITPPGETRMQQNYADYASKEAPAAIATIDQVINRASTGLGLLRTGEVETGTVKTALTTYAKDRWGVDVGDDPYQDAFRSVGISQAAARLKQFGSAPTDRDAIQAEQMGANLTRSAASNEFVLVLDKLTAEREREVLLARQEFAQAVASAPPHLLPDVAAFERWLATDPASPLAKSIFDEPEMQKAMQKVLEERGETVKLTGKPTQELSLEQMQAIVRSGEFNRMGPAQQEAFKAELRRRTAGK